jgi:hypothetical protein
MAALGDKNRVYMNHFRPGKSTRNPAHPSRYITDKPKQMTAPRHQIMDISRKMKSGVFAYIIFLESRMRFLLTAP